MNDTEKLWEFYKNILGYFWAKYIYKKLRDISLRS